MGHSVTGTIYSNLVVSRYVLEVGEDTFLKKISKSWEAAPFSQPCRNITEVLSKGML